MKQISCSMKVKWPKSFSLFNYSLSKTVVFLLIIILERGSHLISTFTDISVPLSNSQQGWGKWGGKSTLLKDVYNRSFLLDKIIQHKIKMNTYCYRYTCAPTVYTHKAIEIWQSQEKLRAPNINNKRPTWRTVKKTRRKCMGLVYITVASVTCVVKCIYSM